MLKSISYYSRICMYCNFVYFLLHVVYNVHVVKFVHLSNTECCEVLQDAQWIIVSAACNLLYGDVKVTKIGIKVVVLVMLGAFLSVSKGSSVLVSWLWLHYSSLSVPAEHT